MPNLSELPRTQSSNQFPQREFPDLGGPARPWLQRKGKEEEENSPHQPCQVEPCAQQGWLEQRGCPGSHSAAPKHRDMTEHLQQAWRIPWEQDGDQAQLTLPLELRLNLFPVAP